MSAAGQLTGSPNRSLANRIYIVQNFTCREIARELLALTDEDIDALAASGDLELGKPAEYDPRTEADPKGK